MISGDQYSTACRTDMSLQRAELVAGAIQRQHGCWVIMAQTFDPVLWVCDVAYDETRLRGSAKACLPDHGALQSGCL